MDMPLPEGPAQLAKSVERVVSGRLDILVLNAGTSKAGALEDHTIPDFNNLFATNVRAPFFLLQQLLPLLGDGSSEVISLHR